MWWQLHISAVNKQNKDLQKELQSKSSTLEDLKSKKANLEKQQETLKKDLQCQLNEKTEVENRICGLQSAHEKQISEFDVKLKDLETAKGSLINSKLAIQNELEDANARTNIVKQELEKAKAGFRKTEERLESELSNLKSDLVSKYNWILHLKLFKRGFCLFLTQNPVVSNYACSFKAKELEVQTQLNQKLEERDKEVNSLHTSSREAIMAANEKEKQSTDKLVDLNKQLDHALSAKLELEAKVESTSDELR